VIPHDNGLMLFETNDIGCDYSSGDDSLSGGEDETNVENPVLGPGSMATFAFGTGSDNMTGMMQTTNLVSWSSQHRMWLVCQVFVRGTHK
jgi:hypothetical protein